MNTFVVDPRVPVSQCKCGTDQAPEFDIHPTFGCTYIQCPACARSVMGEEAQDAIEMWNGAMENSKSRAAS